EPEYHEADDRAVHHAAESAEALGAATSPVEGETPRSGRRSCDSARATARLGRPVRARRLIPAGGRRERTGGRKYSPTCAEGSRDARTTLRVPGGRAAVG